MIGKILKGVANGFLGNLTGNQPGTIRATPGQVDTSGATSKRETHYWQFMPPKKGKSINENTAAVRRASGFGPAPRLAPMNNPDDTQSTDSVPTTHVNVRDNHHWTESPISSRGEVPFLTLKEYKILMNPMLNQMLNNINVAVQATVETADSINSAFKQITSAFEEQEKAKDQSGGGTTTKPDFKSTLKNVQNQITSGLANAAEDAQTDQFADPLEPYKMMYVMKPTLFRYTFPYMEDTYRSVSNSFGDDSSAGGMLGMVNDMAEIGTNAINDLTMRRMREPGIMIEKPKGFTFTGREKSYSVKFPLFNTKSYEEIIKNWQFLFLLVYQNTPNRITKDLVDPPCIYEAKIPGLWYSKYACIDNMRVDFKGARRLMELPVMFVDEVAEPGQSGSTGSKNWVNSRRTITTVIPDAYEVTVSVRELFSETQNFMYHMLRESSDNTVTVNGQ